VAAVCRADRNAWVTYLVAAKVRTSGAPLRLQVIGRMQTCDRIVAESDCPPVPMPCVPGLPLRASVGRAERHYGFILRLPRLCRVRGEMLRQRSQTHLLRLPRALPGSPHVEACVCSSALLSM